MKFATYFFASFLSILCMIYYAYYTQRQFYPTVLFLVSSKVSFILLANMVLAIALCVARFFKSIFFGQLRDAEVELLIEKAKFTIPETCLALTIFRNELTPTVIALFGSLIFIKLLHKLSKCRLEYLEQVMPVSTYKQIRMGCLLVTLIAIDLSGAVSSILYIIQYGRSVLILFGFEFGLLLIYAFNLSVRFIIQLADMHSANGLSSKGLYVMLIDLICELVKFATYLCFFCLIFAFYGMPIHIMRDVWAAYNSCQRKLMNFVQYLKLTRNLDNRFENATAEECAAAGSCLVCREEMEQGKKLPCGHIFHIDCLRMWLQHQQTCPLCRAEIPTDGPRQPNAAPGAAAVQREQNQEQQAQPQAAQREAVPQQQQPQQAPPIPPADSAEARVAEAMNEAIASSSGNTAVVPGAHYDGSLTYPRFCVVFAVPDMPIRSDPSLSAPEIRRIKMGMVVFVSMRMEDAAGRGWLRAPDGWLLEQELHNTNDSGNPAAVVPFPDSLDGQRDSLSDDRITKSMQSDYDIAGSKGPYQQSTPMNVQRYNEQIAIQQRKKFVPLSLPREARELFMEQEKQFGDFNGKLPADSIPPVIEGDSIEDEIDERLAELRDLLRMESKVSARYTALHQAINSSTISRRSETVSKSKPSSLRLREMANLQHHLHDVAKNLAQVSESVVFCQESLAALVKEEMNELQKVKKGNEGAASSNDECSSSSSGKDIDRTAAATARDIIKVDDTNLHLKGEELPLTNESPLDVQRSSARQFSAANISTSSHGNK